MSNLPPGVTGSEYEIAGPSGGVHTKNMACETEDAEVIILPAVVLDRMLDAIRYNTPFYPEDIREVITACDDHTLGVCYFIGDVDVEYHHGYAYWTCPLCGTDHETEIDRDNP